MGIILKCGVDHRCGWLNAVCRTQKRAREAAERMGSNGDDAAVPAGTYVQVHVADVPAEAAAGVLARVEASAQVREPLHAAGNQRRV